MSAEVREHLRTYNLVKLGVPFADIDSAPAVTLDWLLQIDATVAKEQSR